MNKVQPGDKLAISANAYNSFVDAANNTKVMQEAARVWRLRFPDPARIDVQNDTEQAMERYCAAMLTTPVIEVGDGGANPAQNENNFQNRLVMKVVEPTAAAMEESMGVGWCVVQEPLGVEKIGHAVIAGATQLWLNLSDEGDTYVDVQAGGYIPTTTSEPTNVRILWVHGGAGTASTAGEQWAVVYIGAAASLPTGQYQWQGFVMVSNNVAGWEFDRVHPLL